MPFTEDPTAGEFSGTPKLEFIDTPGVPNRNVRVIENFTFTEAANRTVWVAPSGSIIDGASIPRVLWTLVGSPFTGDYVYASIVHDVACDTRARPWRDTHFMFYLACLAGGTKRGRAKLMYLAVRNFGPRWPAPDAVPAPVEQPVGQLAFSMVAMAGGAPVAPFSPFVPYAAQLRYLHRAHAYLATHGEGVSLEAIDIYACRPV